MIILSDKDFDILLERIRDEALKAKPLEDLMQGLTPLNKTQTADKEQKQ
jgi:hypothetical protein